MTQTPLREIIAKAYAHKAVGDPHAIDVNGRPRWEWFLDDADKFLAIFGHLFADRAPFITDKMAADAATVLNKRLTTGDLFGVSRDMLQTALLAAPADPEIVPCGGCGESDPAKRCVGCFHDFGDKSSAWVRKQESRT